MYLYVRGIDFTYSRAPELIPFAWWGRAAHHFIFFVLSCYVSLRSEFRVGMSITISVKKRCSGRLCLQLFLGECMSYAYCVAFLFLFLFLFLFFFWFSSSCVPCCQFLWVVFFFIAPSILTNVHFLSFLHISINLLNFRTFPTV